MNTSEVLSDVYRATGGQLFDDFLRIQLTAAVKYRRAAGFFSSSIFSLAAESFIEFFRRGGQMELVCSPIFSRSDIDALHRGLYNSRQWELRSLVDVIQLPRAERKTALLSCALAHRCLDVRIADLTVRNSHAIYHEKIGIFTRAGGRYVGFEGSVNESFNGYVRNFERITAHDSETSPLHAREAERLSLQFELLWENRTPGVDVVTLHEAFRLALMRARGDESVNTPLESSPETGRLLQSPPEHLRRPFRLALRDYQESAIREWFRAQGKGIYSMATGTGKTITALSTLEELFRRCGPPMTIIIVAPYLNLVEQWKVAAKDFGLDPIICCGSRDNWVGALEAATYLVNSRRRPLLSLLTTNATFAQEPFQLAMRRIDVRTVLVADEVHNLGARNLQSALPERVKLRLGLSATPERWMDEDGTRAIADYFGSTVYNLDLAEALKLDPPVLTPYSYHPILVSLEPDEKDEYLRITKQLACYIVSPRTENLSDIVLSLLLKRARIIACARRKLGALAAVIEPYRNSRYNLIYCGDGQVEVDSASVSVGGVTSAAVARQVEAVARLLGRDFEMNVGIYTSEVAMDRRAVLLDEFECGVKNALIAIRCLDEGVDIPNVRRAFILASSTNPRQFVQRRGRVLRRADGKDHAEIYDFVVIPPFDSFQRGTPEFKVIRNLVTKEMSRVTEFAELAINGPQAYSRLLPVLSALKLMHV